MIEADLELAAQVPGALARGLDWLHRRQLPSGEFQVLYIDDRNGPGQWGPVPCIFPTALVSECLLALPNSPATENMLDRACRFLIANGHGPGLWSHFPEGHFLRALCGPDVDDTACICALLRARGITAPLARSVPLLLANRNAKGLFHTWFVTRPCWSLDLDYWRVVLAEWRHPRTTLRYWLSMEGPRNGVDGVVNANVLYYLGDCPQTQPVIDYLLRIIANHEEARCDLWYHQPNVVYYFFSRNYARGISRLEPARQPMMDRIRASAGPDGRLGATVLETAMGACALMNLGVPASELTATIHFLLQSWMPEGGWPRGRLYYGGKSDATAWGSEELTTGFCLEALARFQAGWSGSRKTP
jgi:hypothetical protein